MAGRGRVRESADDTDAWAFAADSSYQAINASQDENSEMPGLFCQFLSSKLVQKRPGIPL